MPGMSGISGEVPVLMTTAPAVTSRVSSPAWTRILRGPVNRASPCTRVTVSRSESIALLAARSLSIKESLEAMACFR